MENTDLSTSRVICHSFYCIHVKEMKISKCTIQKYNMQKYHNRLIEKCETRSYQWVGSFATGKYKILNTDWYWYTPPRCVICRSFYHLKKRDKKRDAKKKKKKKRYLLHKNMDWWTPTLWVICHSLPCSSFCAEPKTIIKFISFSQLVAFLEGFIVCHAIWFLELYP